MRKAVYWTVLEPQAMKAESGAPLKKLPDNSILAQGKNPEQDTYTITVTTTLTGITAVRLEAMTDPSLPNKGPGRAANGNFVLTDLKVTQEPLAAEGKQKPGAFRRAVATFSQEGFAVAQAIDNNPATGWAIAPQLGKEQVAAFETKGKLGLAGGTKLTFTLVHKSQAKTHNLGRFRLSVTTATPPVQLQGLPDNIAKILHTPAEKRSDAEKATIVNFYRSKDTELARLQRVASELTVPPDARTMAAQDIAWSLMNTPAFLFNH
jgi:hypothetical protein